MRQRLVVLVLAQSLLWAAGGVAMLAVIAHEHVHHADSHDHAGALRTAAHGHIHETEPNHEHEFVAPLVAMRVVSFASWAPAIVAHSADAPPPSPTESLAADGPARSGIGPPAHLAHCALLT